MDARSDRDDVATLRDGAPQPSRFRLRCGRNPRCTHAARSSASTSVFQARNLNHVTLATSDLARSRDFYQHILGLPVLKQDGDGLVLGAGKQFIGVDLASKAKEKVGIDHFCVGIDGFDADKARHSLATQSLETFTEFGSGVYSYDPDGNKVQVSAPDYQA
jgi:catechol 2,3-dioxygenase-like lactoylglutathione lyase family enzyme